MAQEGSVLASLVDYLGEFAVQTRFTLSWSIDMKSVQKFLGPWRFPALLSGVAFLTALTVALGPSSAVPTKPVKEKEKETFIKDPKLVADQLKQIALALHNYHDTYRTFPAAAITDKNGKPLLSWRVAILPFIEEDNLYKEFKLNEPWDSKHNKALLKKMPKIYLPEGHKTKVPYSTFYRGFVGNGAFFNATQGTRIADITDGTSNTFMVVEAGEAVPWTKPDDLPYDPKKKLPKLGGLCKDGFHALFADGAVYYLKKKIDAAVLHLYITRNDGQPVADINDLIQKD